MKIKALVFIIAMALVVSCVGCASGNGDDNIHTSMPTVEPTNVTTTMPTEEPTAVPTQTPTEVPTIVPTEEPTAAPTETPAKTPTKAPTKAPTPTKTPAPTPTSQNQSVLQVRGSWANGVYTNRFLGLSYTLTAGWQAATDEEILQMMNIGFEVLGNTAQLQQALENQQVVYDFYVINLTTGSNINITFENLSKVLGGSLITEEDYANITKQQLENVQGMTYIVGDYEQVRVGDKTFLKLPVMAEYAGTTITQGVYLCKIGNYMCSITVTGGANDTQTPEQLMEAFTKA